MSLSARDAPGRSAAFPGCGLVVGLWLLSGAGWVSAAGPGLGTPAPLLNDAAGGAALAADLRNAHPDTDAEIRGVLKIRHKTGQTDLVPVVSRITAGTNSWQSTYVASPSNHTEVLVVIHTLGQPNQYRLASLEGTNAPVHNPPPCDHIWTRFAGSDFLLADLGLEFFHWPHQVLVQNEMRKNRACHVLQSRPAVTNNYALVLSWIDVETGGLIMAEAYDEKGRRVKEFEVKSFKKAGERWQLQEMEIRDLKERSRTDLEFEVQGR